MIHEKSPGSVWNVALVAIAVMLGAMALTTLVSVEQPRTVAAASN